jgi:hypothetical protein
VLPGSLIVKLTAPRTAVLEVEISSLAPTSDGKTYNTVSRSNISGEIRRCQVGVDEKRRVRPGGANWWVKMDEPSSAHNL